MTPGEFTINNSIEILPDPYRRQLTAEARLFAGQSKPPREDFGNPESYWEAVVIEHTRLLWLDAYQTRLNRLKRMS